MSGSSFHFLNSRYCLRLLTVCLYVLAPAAGRSQTLPAGTRGPGSGRPQLMSSLSFTNITDSIPNTGVGAHGVFFADITGNNAPDMYITRLWIDPLTDLLFINDPVSGRLHEEGEIRGAADYDGGSHGACFADFDNDGDYDIINGTTFAPGRTGPEHNTLLQNNGDGFFTDITYLSPDVLSCRRETRSILAFDADKDGDLDIFSVTGYLGSADSASGSNELYLNNGSGVFTRSGNEVLRNTRAGQGATDTDYDGDGDIDIIAANRTGDLIIFRNDSFGNFTLIPPADIMDIPARAGDGITMGDIDNDGDLDMLLVSAGPPGRAHLYRNDGTGFFYHDTTWEHINGYMGGFCDLDNDGDLDLIFAGDSICYLNDGAGNFSPGPALDAPAMRDPRSIAFADLDNDGDMDFAVTDRDSCTWLFRNELSGSAHWLRVALTSPQGQAGAFGSKITVRPAYHSSGTILGFRETRSAAGYLAQNDPLVHFGLGEHASVDVTVEFTDGTTAHRTNIPADRTLRIKGADVLFRGKLFLEGAWEPTSGRMRTDLAAQGLVPLVSPYNEDPRRAAYIPFDAVDWVLIEIYRSLDGSAAAAKSVLLYADGKLKDPSGREFIPLNLSEGAYYVSIRHRNHLTARSPAPVYLHRSVSPEYNFSAAENRYLQPRSAKELAPGLWSIAAGNCDSSDGFIFASDLAAVQEGLHLSAAGYYAADINLDGRITLPDYELCMINLLAGRYDRKEPQ